MRPQENSPDGLLELFRARTCNFPLAPIITFSEEGKYLHESWRVKTRMLRSLLLFAVLGLSVAGAKTYDVTFDSATKIGSVELKAGKYSLAVMDDSKVRFTSSNGQAVEASAKVTTGDKKFQATQVDLKQVNGTAQVNEIDLGGTKTKILFE